MRRFHRFALTTKLVLAALTTACSGSSALKGGGEGKKPVDASDASKSDVATSGTQTGAATTYEASIIDLERTSETDFGETAAFARDRHARLAAGAAAPADLLAVDCQQSVDAGEGATLFVSIMVDGGDVVEAASRSTSACSKFRVALDHLPADGRYRLAVDVFLSQDLEGEDLPLHVKFGMSDAFDVKDGRVIEGSLPANIPLSGSDSRSLKSAISDTAEANEEASVSAAPDAPAGTFAPTEGSGNAAGDRVWRYFLLTTVDHLRSKIAGVQKFSYTDVYYTRNPATIINPITELVSDGNVLDLFNPTTANASDCSGTAPVAIHQCQQIAHGYDHYVWPSCFANQKIDLGVIGYVCSPRADGSCPVKTAPLWVGNRTSTVNIGTGVHPSKYAAATNVALLSKETLTQNGEIAFGSVTQMGCAPVP